MKVVRQLLRARLLDKIPTLARVDRFNQQYNNLDQDDQPDYESGVVYIEVLPVQWEQLGSDKIQEADATIRLHVCRTFYGSSASDEETVEPLDILDLPVEVFKALQGVHLIDGEGRTVARTFTRTGSQEDNDHDGLEVDIIDFTTRLTDYSALPKKKKAIADPTIENDQTLKD
jgi:hypothetical protein